MEILFVMYSTAVSESDAEQQILHSKNFLLHVTKPRCTRTHHRMYHARSLEGPKYQHPTQIPLATVEHPVNITTALYLIAPYSAPSTNFERTPELIGPARTISNALTKTKNCKSSECCCRLPCDSCAHPNTH